jgi:uracil-DNA glycosylase
MNYLPIPAGAITGHDWANRKCILVDAVTRRPVFEGEKRAGFRGEYTIMGATPPHKASSTGRVLTEEGGEYFPSVANVAWELVL